MVIPSKEKHWIGSIRNEYYLKIDSVEVPELRFLDVIETY